MRINVFTILGVILLNLIILLYEKGFDWFTWRQYAAYAIITAVCVMFPMFGIILLIPITGYNILNHTTRIRREYGK